MCTRLKHERALHVLVSDNGVENCAEQDLSCDALQHVEAAYEVP